MHRAPWVVVLLAMAACTQPPAESGPVKTYTGLYVSDFEMSTFLPEGIAENWWLESSVELALALDKLQLYPQPPPVSPQARIAKLIVEGTATELGQWGHLGTGQRKLTVTRIIDAQPAHWEDFGRAQCKLPDPEWLKEQDKADRKKQCDALEAPAAR